MFSSGVSSFFIRNLSFKGSYMVCQSVHVVLDESSETLRSYKSDEEADS